jgi:hypothetical protein
VSLTDELEKLGESEVRKRLVNGGFGSPGSQNYSSVKEWLRGKEIEHINIRTDTQGKPQGIKISNSAKQYVHPERIKELEEIGSGKFDLCKLLMLCKELNDSYRTQSVLSIIMLTRALIDHVPPIFECRSFSEVANNYGGTKSFKESMERLNLSSRKIADQHLHTPIRKKESIPTMNQVDFSNDIDVLLAEVYRILKRP